MPHKSYVAASVPEKWEAFQISSSSNQFENPFKSAINIFKSFFSLSNSIRSPAARCKNNNCMCKEGYDYRHAGTVGMRLHLLKRT